MAANKEAQAIPVTTARTRLFELVEEVLTGRTSRVELAHRGYSEHVLNRIERKAQEQGFHSVLLEAPENRRLPELLVPPLRKLLLQLDRGERVRERARSALRALRNFASAFRVTMGDLEVGVEPAPGVADSGNLEFDLTDLLVEVAEAARESETAVALLAEPSSLVRNAASGVWRFWTEAARRLAVGLGLVGRPHVDTISARPYLPR